MDILIARQPIFDFNRRLFAYELAMARIGVARKDVYELYLQSLEFAQAFTDL
jgi:c-di-GMP-related signal transduction protein